MSEISERYKKVATQFTRRAKAVPENAWDNPAPCDGWVARDVVQHMVEWIPAFFESNAALELTSGPSVDDDPAGAWEALSDGIKAALDDPVVAVREFDMQMGRYTIEDAVATFCIGDILIHTWDLARATGLDERIDAEEVHRLFEAMEPIDDVLRESGHYGPRVHVRDDADEQTKLIAFSGRRPEVVDR